MNDEPITRATADCVHSADAANTCENLYPDWNALEANHWNALARRSEKAVRGLVHREWLRRFGAAMRHTRGVPFASRADRWRAAERAIGFTRDEVFGGEAGAELVFATTPGMVRTFVDRAGEAEDWTLLYRAVRVLGISEANVASAIQQAQSGVRGSLRYQKARKALEAIGDTETHAGSAVGSHVSVDLPGLHRQRPRRDYSVLRT